MLWSEKGIFSAQAERTNNERGKKPLQMMPVTPTMM
jgi:hypothetical protein